MGLIEFLVRRRDVPVHNAPMLAPRFPERYFAEHLNKLSCRTKRFASCALIEKRLSSLWNTRSINLDGFSEDRSRSRGSPVIMVSYKIGPENQKGIPTFVITFSYTKPR